MRNNKNTNVNSIENGYFIFTLMPSLKCSLNCPHCYLTQEQRSDSFVMPIESIEKACLNVDDYYNKRGIEKKTIVNYWYGGEPTEMGIDYTVNAMETINNVFSLDKGYTSKHTVLSSLVGIKNDDEWIEVFKKYCNNYIQTSFDGFMRGKGYVRNWEKKVRLYKESGLDVGTISVVNEEILEIGAIKILDYLSELGIKETSWLPFMLNIRNNETGMYNKFAPTMQRYSDFMIELSNHYLNRKNKGLHVPELGQVNFVSSQRQSDGLSNIAGQTLFLMPNGDLSLPDYPKDGYKEYLNVFGNVLNQSFEDILTSKGRRDYLRKQVMKNNNKECLSCDYSDSCIMEFWKKNRDGDDCFGAKKFVKWVHENKKSIGNKSCELY